MAATATPPAKPERRATAETMAARQREISVSEFFTKNRHLLGFDNPAKALLTTVKEAVDNALDACEEAGILPSLRVEIVELSPAGPKAVEEEAEAPAKGKDKERARPAPSSRFRVAIEDNGPGIVRAQIPKIFAKLLYGSKFHRLKQSRGQQGIGISAAGLYGQLTTGKPITITSKIGKKKPTHRITLRIDTRRNAPDILTDVELDPNGKDAESIYWASVDHGTRVEIELTGTYRKGSTGVDAYLEQTVVANPHLELYYQPPRSEPIHYPRVADELPREPQEIKPHPHGVELGMLLKMMQDAEGKTVVRALQDDFSKVSQAVASAVCEAAAVSVRAKASDLTGDQVERLHHALAQVKIPAPSAACVVPIGEPLIVEGLKRRFKAEFYTSATRPPAVYRGNPFVVEVGLAYGGELPTEEPAEVLRFANRVPLQYQPRACAVTEAVYDTNWKNYELQQPKGSLPIGPLAIFVHLASVWVPFTSEAKEAVAHYPELLEEIRLALREVGRRLGMHLRARQRERADAERRSIFERYIPEVSAALATILSDDKDKIAKQFQKTLDVFVRVAPEAASGDAAPDSGTSGPSAPSMPPPPDDTSSEGVEPRRAVSEAPVAPRARAPKPEPRADRGAKPKKKKAEQLDLPVIHAMKR